MFDLQILVDIAGVAGFLLSFWLACCGWLLGRERYRFDVLDYADFGGTSRFFVTIQNDSSRPLVVREIRYLGTTCELLPKKIRGEPGSWNGETTRRFPIRVLPHDVEAVFLEFLVRGHSPLAPDTWVSFQIQTTSRLGSKTVLLCSKSHYLRRTP